MIIMITNITIVIDLFGYNQEQRAEASYSDIDRGTLKTNVIYFNENSYNLVSDCLLCSSVIRLDLESHSHFREKVQFIETRSRIIFLGLT